NTNNLNAPILVMEHEHEAAGDLIKSIRSLTNNYIPPAFACPTYQLTYKMLQEFDNDLMQHIHLENNILFPKAQMLNQN
ncbi:MAG: hemerythrin domain-containing protein, partial [Bacteroidia bacterium]|nr:hemerythrin domain-containing protein [Bacteroidia bacterium]